MMTLQIPTKVFTIEEYLTLEKKSKVKLEYLNGKIKEMPGGTFTHNKIVARVLAALVNAIDEADKPYEVSSSDTKIQIPKYNHFVYPDAVVICEKPQFYKNRKDIIVNPLLVVEVLSPSTEKHDRSAKFLEYRTLPSFKEYVLVSQQEILVNSFYQEEPKLWREIEAEGINSSIHLKSIDCHISLQKIYKNIKF